MELAVFIAELKRRNVCPVNVASNAAQWWHEVKAHGGHFETYLDHVDCREGGCKLLHSAALQAIQPQATETAGGWAD